MKKLFILFIPFLILVSCNDDPPTTPVIFDPEMTADISGEIEILFESQTFVTAANQDGRYVVMLACPMTTDSINYNMTLYIYYKNDETAGVFPITGVAGIDSVDYAVASFSTSVDGETEQIFLSTSGSVSITSIIGTRITGSFNFEAESTEGLKVSADNGVLDIYH